MRRHLPSRRARNKIAGFCSSLTHARVGIQEKRKENPKRRDETPNRAEDKVFLADADAKAAQ
jgi:hypothetical protein